jgi:phosphate transport system substrate-binding protein
MESKTLRSVAALIAGGALLGGCNDAEATQSTLTGEIVIDGSSTVYPITQAIAEEFRHVHPKVQSRVGLSGTGGGFKKFSAGETDISDASRPIKESEAASTAAAGVTYVELPVAYDGLTVVVSKANTWVDHLTVAELKRIWDTGSKVNNWNEVRDGFPDKPLKLFGPGTDSGTFDYFTEAINGKSGQCRSDFTASEDDNVLVTGVAGSEGGLGFFGFAYYKENRDKLIAGPIQDSGAPVAPTIETINDGSYAPLSRPVFIYVSTAAAARPEVKAFIDFYLETVPMLIEEVGYVALPDAVYAGVRQRFANRVAGSAYASPDAQGKSLLELYSRQ